MASSDTLQGWTPKPVQSHRPVQCESAGGGLCGAELPNRQGILLWPYGSEVHCAVVADPSQFVVDNVVPIGDVRVAISGLGSVQRTSVFVLSGQLYCILASQSGIVGNVALYKANSPTDPTSWALRYTFSSLTLNGPGFGEDVNEASIPIELASGRWVLVQMCWNGNADAHGSQASGFYSDDQGATWTNTFNFSHPYFFARVDTVAGQIARDPSTGYLYTSSWSRSGGLGVAHYQSTNDGVSWVWENNGGIAQTGWDPNGSAYLQPFLNNGSTMYALSSISGGTGRQIYYPVGDPNVSLNWQYTGYDFESVDASNKTRKGIIANNSVYFFSGDYVAFVSLQGWLVGQVGI